MGITKTGPVSYRAVREDVDLASTGSTFDRAVKDKVQKQGSVKLSDFKGNIFGMQYLTYNTSSEAGWNKLRDRTAGLGYLMNSPAIYTSGTRIYVPCTDNYSQDIGVEARLTGKVLESGTYTLSGSTFGEYDTNYYNGEMHINLISNSVGYLVGTNNTLVNQILLLDRGMGDNNWYHSVSLSTSQPFITLIVRNIHKAGGRGRTTTHQFWNWKLVRI